MRWQIHHDCTKDSIPTIVETILKNRGFTDRTQIDGFLKPPPPQLYNPESVGIDSTQLDLAVSLLNTSIANQQPIIVYGDYDADGITATGILWETLHYLGANTVPFIPSRELHGYGLSILGLKDALKLVKTTPLIITVDNGIVAIEAADWLKQHNIPLIITDHHTKTDQLPHALAIVHSTQICGAGVAWFLIKELSPEMANLTLDLATIGTISDMMPLIGINRSLAKYGLKSLSSTKRPGLIGLLSQAGVDITQGLSPHHISFVVAPRLNAMGRLEHALDSLRLICTKNPNRAAILAEKLGNTNQTRQDLTLELLNYATSQIDATSLQPVIISDDEKYHEGIIGLIAGKLVENFYRPSIVISRKEDISKASARSIKGINITELIRSQSHLLLGIGGHPMAAGFSIETKKIELFKQSLIAFAHKNIDVNLFKPILEIDCLIDESNITQELYQQLQLLEPFGIGNKQPVFAIRQARATSVQSIGKNSKHLKIRFNRQHNLPLDAIWFNPPEIVNIAPNMLIDLTGTINLNTWKNKTRLQLLVKDIQFN